MFKILYSLHRKRDSEISPEPMSVLEQELLPSVSASSPEAVRLGSRPSLQTLLILSIGPVISAVGLIAYDVLNSYWVTRSLGKSGLSAIGSVFVLQYTLHGFGNLIHVALNTKVGFLFARSANERIPCIVLDLIRASLVISLIAPAIVLPLAHPLMDWLSISASLQRQGFLFLIPLASCFCITAFSRFTLGLLQAHGFSLCYGLATFCQFLLSLAVFDPLFLIVFKSGLWGVAVSTLLSDLIVGIAVTAYLVKHCLLLYVSGYNWLGKFSQEGISALKVGFSALINQLAVTWPQVAFQKFLSMSAKAAGASHDVMSVYSLMGSIFNIATMATTAFTGAFLPAASYAYGGRFGGRLLRLSVYFLLIAVGWAVFTGEPFALFPVQLCRIWSPDPEFTEWIQRMIPPSVYTVPLAPIKAVVPSLLQAMKKGKSAVVVDLISQGIGLPAFSAVLYYTGKDDPARLVWALASTDALGFVISVAMSVIPFRKIRTMMRSEKRLLMQYSTIGES
jgi:Na+-driven multidrug efflux pump